MYLPSYDELFYGVNVYSNKMHNFIQNKKNDDLIFINMYKNYKEHQIDSIFPFSIPGHCSRKGYEILADEIKKKIN